MTTLLCDADGNLFPSEETAFVASCGVTNAFLAALGVDARFTPDQLRLATTGKNFRTTAADLAVAYGVPVDATIALGRPAAKVTGAPVLTAAGLQRWVDKERREVSAHLASVLLPDPAVLAPLARLAERHPLAAVSSSATSRLAACFSATGLDALIPAERRYSAEDSLPVPTSKPHPAVYLHACAELDLRPMDAVAVEDSVPGVQSAVAAGIRTIGNVQFVALAERPERVALLEQSGVDAVVTSWAELEELLAP